MQFSEIFMKFATYKFIKVENLKLTCSTFNFFIGNLKSTHQKI